MATALIKESELLVVVRANNGHSCQFRVCLQILYRDNVLVASCFLASVPASRILAHGLFTCQAEGNPGMLVIASFTSVPAFTFLVLRHDWEDFQQCRQNFLAALWLQQAQRLRFCTWDSWLPYQRAVSSGSMCRSCDHNSVDEDKALGHRNVRSKLNTQDPRKPFSLKKITNA